MNNKEDSGNILKYFKDSKTLLESIREHVNKNIESALEQETNKIIKEEYFPDDKIIRELYNELFACYYSNLHNASLSVAMELLEYMSKKLYSIEFSTDYPKKAWSKVITNLINKFKKENKPVEEGIMEMIDGYRQNVRNAQNHGNIPQLVEENAVFYHNAINGVGERVEYPLKYKKEIHGESNFLRAKDEIQNQGTNSSIFLINSFIVQFFIRKI